LSDKDDRQVSVFDCRNGDRNQKNKEGSEEKLRGAFCLEVDHG